MIPFNDLQRFNNSILKEIKKELGVLVKKNSFILSKEVEMFEDEYKCFTNSKYAIGVANGTDALELILRGLGIGTGDEVILQANTFFATAIAISRVGAKPVFIDHDEYYLLDIDSIESALSNKTKAIISVNLYGQLNDNLLLSKIAKKHNLFLIEDSAQSHGAKNDNVQSGNYSAASAYSFYPGKNLGAWGDAGAVTTNNKNLYNKILELRNYGSRYKYVHNSKGFNSRLDSIQALILRKKLSRLNEANEIRNQIAVNYKKSINPAYKLPTTRPGNYHVWHLFVAQVNNRNAFFKEAEGEVEFGIHYPIPINFQKAYRDHEQYKFKFPNTYKNRNKIFSVPLFPELKKYEVNKVIYFLNKYAEKQKW